MLHSIPGCNFILPQPRPTVNFRSVFPTLHPVVERKYGKARRIWVFDQAIVGEENLAAVRKRGGQYLVGTPRRQMKQFEDRRWLTEK